MEINLNKIINSKQTISEALHKASDDYNYAMELSDACMYSSPANNLDYDKIHYLQMWVSAFICIYHDDKYKNFSITEKMTEIYNETPNADLWFTIITTISIQWIQDLLSGKVFLCQK